MLPNDWKPVAKGVATIVPGLYRLVSHHRGGGTASAKYCYSVWAKHLTLLTANGAGIPHTLAELGPGDSLGVGICALLSGATEYFALDVVEYSNAESNLALLDELVALFRRAEPLGAAWPDFSAYLDDRGFPRVLTPKLLANTLSESRVSEIRAALVGKPTSIRIKYVAPWNDESLIERASVDFILSHSVLEHVNDLPHTVNCCAAWLKPGGRMSHQVDFTSHGLTPAWNGHWRYPQWVWRLVVGGRPYLINRTPADVLLELVKRAGLEVTLELHRERHDGLAPEQLHSEWRTHAVSCESLYFQAQRA